MSKFNGMYYYCLGEGKPLVLLHGWGASGKVFYEVARELSLFYKVYVIDFWGFGQSEQPKSNATIYDFAEGIREFLDYLGQNVILIGHSFGGRVSLILGSDKRVKKVILVDSAGILPRFSLKKWYAKQKYQKTLRAVQAGKKDKSSLDSFGSSDYKVLSNEWKTIFKNVVNEDLLGYAKKINKKTLIIWGKRDRDTPLYMAKKLKRAIKESRLVVLEAGHYSFLDQKEKFCKLVFEFLESEEL